jgi:thiol-disulfide isomerase/thioredoxin
MSVPVPGAVKYFGSRASIMNIGVFAYAYSKNLFRGVLYSNFYMFWIEVIGGLPRGDTMKTALYTAMFLVVGLGLSGCSAGKPTVEDAVSSPKPEASPSSGAQVVEAAATNAPWYASRLEALGFYVFPAPEPLPPFTVKTLSGADAGLKALSGKMVLLNFWATWCPPCKEEMPSIQVLHEKMKGSAFEVFAISVGEKAKTVTDFVKASPYTFPMYLDESGTASAPFAGRGIPTTFILDKQGRAIAGIVGSRAYDTPDVLTLFKELAERLP